MLTVITAKGMGTLEALTFPFDYNQLAPVLKTTRTKNSKPYKYKKRAPKKNGRRK